MKKSLQNMLKAALFFGVGFVILYLVYRSQNKAYQAQCALDGVPAESCSLIQKVLEDFASANYFWILMVLVAFTVSNISRSVRWIMLIRPLGYEPRPINAFLTIMLGYFTNLGLPRVGEVIRAGSLANYEKIGVEKTMGTVVVDRMTDMATML
ncbi:MAG: flippase-like domain-containing protein, partial [Phaeodactylibacter sp.]|nr:flippase-like domain-containing protein [Phaeodactylibacter sp.]